jgi:hypothetical protein
MEIGPAHNSLARSYTRTQAMSSTYGLTAVLCSEIFIYAVSNGYDTAEHSISLSPLMRYCSVFANHHWKQGKCMKKSGRTEVRQKMERSLPLEPAGAQT